MALQVVAPDDPRLSWHGHISLQRTADWVMPWRIPYREQDLFPPAAFAASDRQSRAAMPAGVRLAFHSDTSVGRRPDRGPAGDQVRSTSPAMDRSAAPWRSRAKSGFALRTCRPARS